MPNISWNEIRNRAINFSRAWAEATREQADKQTFWNEFFDVFGIARKTVAAFEEPVKRMGGSTGFIDLFWPGRLIAEHKTAGHRLDAAESQAFGYIRDLAASGRGNEAPRYILLSDFRRFALYDLEPEEQRDLPLFHGVRYVRTEFPLADLQHRIRDFAFIPGYKLHALTEQNPADIKAVALMANLHDTLQAGGYEGHDLERLLVRLLFCLFAEDTGIFEPSAFGLFLENRTAADGSDLGLRLNQLFRVLDTPADRRQRNLDEMLTAMPYVNGALFREQLEFAEFNRDGRNALLACTRFDWARISPAVFGALFQEVTRGRRRQIGAHYTSERDILKLIRPLFLDGLRAEFEAAVADKSTRARARLDELHRKLASLKFLDPACGCGNFLVVAYRELRALELDILKERYGTQQALSFNEVGSLSTVDVNQFYGIEIEEWPARIAEVALWLMDHQSNMRVHEAFGQPFVRLPLKNSPHIRHGNALDSDWNAWLPACECSYVLGNPPFIGHHYQSDAQKADQKAVLREIEGRGVLDYVTNWYWRACEYIGDMAVQAAFVSTNSICQGEQAGVFWNGLFERFGVKITFAYQTFAWESEARGKAHVHVVIVGFARQPAGARFLFQNAGGEVARTAVENISPYLVAGPDRAFVPIPKPICEVPQMFWGNKPTDGGHLLLSEEERAELLAKEPGAGRFVRRYMSGGDFLDGAVRYCLWLTDASPAELKALPSVRERLERVAVFRKASKAESTRRFAAYPALFRQIAQPDRPYLAVPEVSSERRAYVPMAMLPPEVICSNTVQFVMGATAYHFGILTSGMHMAWVRRVAGRLESRYRYSNTLVYNNYPWPAPTDAQRARVEELAGAVLAARALYPDSTLAALYDPLLMPKELLDAHRRLDRAVERCYRPEPFANDAARVEFLFALHEKLTAPLLSAEGRKRGRKGAREGV